MQGFFLRKIPDIASTGAALCGQYSEFFFRINEWFQLLQYRSKGFSDFTEKRCDKELISHIVLYSASWRKTMSALRIDLILFTSSLDVALWIEIRIVLRIFLRRVGYRAPSRICTMWSHPLVTLMKGSTRSLYSRWASATSSCIWRNSFIASVAASNSCLAVLMVHAFLSNRFIWLRLLNLLPSCRTDSCVDLWKKRDHIYMM
jgi:hypothetical protein